MRPGLWPAPVPATCMRRSYRRARAGEKFLIKIGGRLRFLCSNLARSAGGKRNLGQAKVENLRVSTFGHEDIRWLYIAVDDSFGMRCIKSVGNLNRQTEQGFELDRLFSDAVFQRHAIQKLHDDEGPPILLPDLINRADI